MGVSASHLDWTMVPYVRKSFYKHFKDGFKYLYDDEDFKEQSDIENISIDDEDYKYYILIHYNQEAETNYHLLLLIMELVLCLKVEWLQKHY